jgi:DNA-binding beta-propeller fold protein YncE
MTRHIFYIVITCALTLLSACRNDDIIFIPEEVEVTTPEYTSIEGFYLLNEGNMGSNKATLDYYDYTTGTYTRNIYGNANPSVPKEMGDVGNDIAIYGSRLYAVINCSNKVEVMNARTAERIGQIEIPNCRYIKFYEGYAYVTSYAGPVEINPNYTQKGYVAKVDTATLEVVDRCIVGFQPDELDIADGKIYVANSGGYMVPNYENTVSVIDLETFTETERIEIAINLDRLRADSHGQIWVSSRGDYYEIPSRLYCYDIRKRRLIKELDVPVGDMCMVGDSIYVISNSYSYVTANSTTAYAIVNTRTCECVSENFITDGTQTNIRVPYGISINPITRDIYVTDARNYVNPGYLHCYSADGVLKWSVRTGDIPAHIAFLGTTQQ